MDIIQEAYGSEKELGEDEEIKLPDYSLMPDECITNEDKSEIHTHEVECKTEDATDFEPWDSKPEDGTRSMIAFYTQTLVILIIVISCIINMSLGNGDQTAWTGLLSTSLGILLPQPGVNWSKHKNKKQKHKPV